MIKYILKCEECKDSEIEITEEIGNFIRKHNVKINLLKRPGCDEIILKLKSVEV